MFELGTTIFKVPAITAGTAEKRSFRVAYQRAGAKRHVLKIYNGSKTATIIIQLDNGDIIRVRPENFFEIVRPGGIAWYLVDATADTSADEVEAYEEDLGEGELEEESF